MSESKIESFDEFWPFYVGEHSNKRNRQLHFAGTTAGLIAAALGMVSRKRWLVGVAPLLGYGGAWIGHFFVEKNTPATFRYPLWSLRADFKMYGKILAGTMDEEVERVTARSEPARSEPARSEPARSEPARSEPEAPKATATDSSSDRGTNGKSTRVRI